MARAGKSIAFALATSLSSWAAPSSRLYSEWTCRWTKSFGMSPPVRGWRSCVRQWSDDPCREHGVRAAGCRARLRTVVGATSCPCALGVYEPAGSRSRLPPEVVSTSVPYALRGYEPAVSRSGLPPEVVPTSFPYALGGYEPAGSQSRLPPEVVSTSFPYALGGYEPAGSQSRLPPGVVSTSFPYALGSPSARLAKLLPLNGRRWFGGNVEHDPVHALHLVVDPAGDGGEQVVGEAGPVR